MVRISARPTRHLPGVLTAATRSGAVCREKISPFALENLENPDPSIAERFLQRDRREELE
jgi:hypothetical protein